MQNLILFILVWLVPIGQFAFIMFDKSNHNLAVWWKNVPIALLGFLVLPFSDFNIKRPFVKFSLLLSLATALSITQLQNYSDFYPRDFVIFITCFLIFNLDFKVKLSHVRVFSILLCLGFLISSYSQKGAVTNLDPLVGISTWESHFLSYAIGLLALFFFLERDFLFLTITTIAFFLALKRLAFLFFIGLCFFDFTLGRFFEKKNYRILFEFCVFFLICFMSFFISEFFSLINIDIRFASNRDQIFSTIIEAIRENFTLNQIIFGSGPGYSKFFMEKFGWKSMALHNEFFLFLIDYGVFGFGVYMYILRKIYSTSRELFFLGIFTIACAISDSVITNSIYLITFLMLTNFYFSFENSKNSNDHI